MRTKTATFFECKVRYEKIIESGEQKKVAEHTLLMRFHLPKPRDVSLRR